MPLVRLKDKGQVTIPAAVREQIAAHEGDMFDVGVENGAIVLRPQLFVGKASAEGAKGVDIGRWIGAGKGSFKSPEEADEFIHRERALWE